jgi:glutathione reductase (NADPH)
MLMRFEPELVGWLMDKFSEIGVEVRTGAAVEATERAEGGFRVRARAGNEAVTVEADLVVPAGRGPDLEALNLPAAGKWSRSRRICADDRQRPGGRLGR